MNQVIYKNKFVALYDQDDICVFVADNWPELARFLGRTVNQVQSSLSHIFLKDKKFENYERRCLNYNGKKLTPYLFCVEED